MTDAREEAVRLYWDTDAAEAGCRRAQRDAFVAGAAWQREQAVECKRTHLVPVDEEYDDV